MERTSSKDLFRKEGIAILLFLACLIFLSLMGQPGLGTAPNVQALERAAAPWIFGPIQVLLLYLPAWVAGVVIPGTILLVFLGLPWLARWLGEKRARGLFLGFSLLLVLLLLWFMGIEYWWT